MRISIVHGRLEAEGQGLQFSKLGHRAAVDLLNPCVVIVRRRQQRIAHRPVEERPLGRTADRVIQPQMLRIISELTPTAVAVVLVIFAVNQVTELLRSAGKTNTGSDELTLILEVNRHRLTQHRHRLGARGPGEVGIVQQTIIAGQCRQEVAVGIAVTLREHPLRIGLVDHAVSRAAAGFLLDIVVRRVKRLPAVDAAGEVPVKTVVGRRGLHAGADAVVAAAQQREFLIQRAGNLPLKREAAGVHRSVVQ